MAVHKTDGASALVDQTFQGDMHQQEVDVMERRRQDREDGSFWRLRELQF